MQNLVHELILKAIQQSSNPAIQQSSNPAIQQSSKVMHNSKKSTVASSFKLRIIAKVHMAPAFKLLN